MNEIKRLLFTLVLAGASSFALADEWIWNKLDNGEIVYKSGHHDSLYVGSRGVGFKTMQAIQDEDAIFVTFDDGKPISTPVSTLFRIGNVYLFVNSKELLPLMLKAKKVEVSFGSCGNFFRGYSIDCFFAKPGEPYLSTWEFDKPLGESYKPH
jgi:hypothetical protein